MIYHVNNFLLPNKTGKLTLRIETTDNEIINVHNKYLDYFVVLNELINSGINVIDMDYNFNDEDIQCIDVEINRLILNKHIELFGGYDNRRKYIKCLKMLGM
jgi:hypothetical protein